MCRHLFSGLAKLRVHLLAVHADIVVALVFWGIVAVLSWGGKVSKKARAVAVRLTQKLDASKVEG